MFKALKTTATNGRSQKHKNQKVKKQKPKPKNSNRSEILKPKKGNSAQFNNNKITLKIKSLAKALEQTFKSVLNLTPIAPIVKVASITKNLGKGMEL